ncbi:ankyrin repeat domain-containing protein 29-like [Sitodiplosis mosellana]|uniref:ankyrin repeat domain-containing protein 29-like n=1 Tax=Sitodiplosis mosellana TaxID=263140 RepID=UPI002444E362|nr:ankyrin repeat domain-containing protein 29-like [Sitodiplosis mosellana]
MELIKNDAEINLKNIESNTVIHYAAANGHGKIVDELLKNNAFLIQIGRAKVVDELMKHSSDVNLQNMNGDTALHIAAQKGHSSIVTALLKNDANVNLKNKDGKTPIFIAVEKYRDDIFEDLLKHNADVNVKNRRGETLLSVALRPVNQLHKYGAEDDTKTTTQYENMEKLFDEYLHGKCIRHSGKISKILHRKH